MIRSLVLLLLLAASSLAQPCYHTGTHEVVYAAHGRLAQPGWVEITRAEFDAVKALPSRHIKDVNGKPAPMTQAERDAMDAALVDASDVALRFDLLSQLWVTQQVKTAAQTRTDNATGAGQPARAAYWQATATYADSKIADLQAKIQALR